MVVLPLYHGDVMLNKDFHSAVFAWIQVLWSTRRAPRKGNVSVSMRISASWCAVNGFIQRHWFHVSV